MYGFSAPLPAPLKRRLCEKRAPICPAAEMSVHGGWKARSTRALTADFGQITECSWARFPHLQNGLRYLTAPVPGAEHGPGTRRGLSDRCHLAFLLCHREEEAAFLLRPLLSLSSNSSSYRSRAPLWPRPCAPVVTCHLSNTPAMQGLGTHG